MTSTTDPRSAQARQYLLTHLNDPDLTWDTYRAAVGAQTGLASGPLTAVLNDLELEGTLTYDLDGRIRRSAPGDPAEHPLMTVAAAVMGLDWSPGRWTGKTYRPKGGRSIREAYEDLHGQYRHVDVFLAMHQHLKNTQLRVGQTYWVLIADDTPRCLCGCGTAVTRSFAEGHDGRFRGQLQTGILTGRGNTATARVSGFTNMRTMRERLRLCVTYLERLGHPALADQLARDVTPHLPPTLEHHITEQARELDALPEDTPPRRALERELCDLYAATIPGALVEHRLSDECRIDVWDRRSRRVIEAKLDPGVVSVAHAYAQAAAYRTLLNDTVDNTELADRITVLLPTVPTANARRFLESQSYLEAIELVYLDADTFRREILNDGPTHTPPAP